MRKVLCMEIVIISAPLENEHHWLRIECLRFNSRKRAVNQVCMIVCLYGAHIFHIVEKWHFAYAWSLWGRRDTDLRHFSMKNVNPRWTIQVWNSLLCPTSLRCLWASFWPLISFFIYLHLTFSFNLCIKSWGLDSLLEILFPCAR